MQDEYFTLWLGKWTSAIDWTAAVMGTHLSAALYSLSHSLTYTMPGTFDKSRKLDVEAQMVENEVNKYFAQSTTYYFGEDYFAIRNQAYDDILWVVLGWLESIQFINAHSESHYPTTSERPMEESEWHGRQFTPAFAHRARVFYELAEDGWDWRLCGGGLTWNPRLLPYKNAITNELFIAASASMYLYFPGDDNCSPFLSAQDAGVGPDGKKLRAQENGHIEECTDSTSDATYDPIYLANAVNGYDWLKNIGMQNDQGLYVDGFHIRGYRQNHSLTECNERNEMVYTYNQGVILTGLRGLWEGTGNVTYLEDGHELIRNVIRATGWKDSNIAPFVSFEAPEGGQRLFTLKPRPTPNEWSGLGSRGILTELCDPVGNCNQNGHTFKGIFFHHMTTFCRPLPRLPARPGKTYGANPYVAKLHRQSCNEYTAWILHNGNAALGTRDEKGRFGTWWGASLLDEDAKELLMKRGPSASLPEGGVDYRNSPYDFDDEAEELQSLVQERSSGGVHIRGDLNDRGRGRTVETQGGGVAITRAMWEFLRNYELDV
jgi:hypothetical protein